MERSIALAAGMESRGFARTARDQHRGSLVLMLVSVMLATFGAFLLLGSSALPLALACLSAGVAGAAWGLRRAGRRLRVSRYRPQPWRWRDSVIACCGAVAAAITLGLSLTNPGSMNPSTDPLLWPPLDLGMVAVALLAVAPVAATLPPRSHSRVALPSGPSMTPEPRPRAVEAVAA